MSDETVLSLDEVLAILQDETQVLSASALYGLSSLQTEEMTQLMAVWPKLSIGRRQKLLSRLNETSEKHFEYDFSALAELALDDPDEKVRWLGIKGLWEVQTPSLLRRLMEMLTNDPSPAVRENAASALGPFVLLAELGKMPEEIIAPAEQLLLQIITNPDEPPDVRRRSLESLAYSSHDDLRELIEDAYYHADQSMKASAIFAMGRSCDSYWASYILEELESGDDELRFEAARAAGEIELDEAVPVLIELLASEDIEVRAAVVWTLGEIGGADARRALIQASTIVENESLQEDIEDALATAALADGSLNLMDMSDTDTS